MAYVGLSNPYIAKLVDEAEKTYTDCFACGKAMTVNITPNYNEAKLYANNQLAENVKEFKDGNITLGTDRLPTKAMTVCFGHTVSEDEKEVVYKTNDAANYVGVVNPSVSRNHASASILEENVFVVFHSPDSKPAIVPSILGVLNSIFSPLVV